MRALILFSLFLSGSAFAAVPFTPFDAVAWKNLQTKAAASSIVTDNGEGLQYRSLQRISDSDPTKSHTAEYFSAVGGIQSDGTFGISHVEIVSENWQVDAQQNRNVDQWAYAVATDGHITFVMHQQFTETPDGHVTRDDELAVPASLDDPALLAQVGAKVQEWTSAP